MFELIFIINTCLVSCLIFNEELYHEFLSRTSIETFPHPFFGGIGYISSLT